MKKITNNTFLGKITMLLNLLIMVFFIISMVFLLKFDKINVEKVQLAPNHEKLYEQVQLAEHNAKQNFRTYNHYVVQYDTLSTKEAPKDKQLAKDLSERIERCKGKLDENKATYEQSDSIFKAEQAAFEPISTEFKTIEQNTAKAKGTFSIFMGITIFLFICKIFFFAFWNFKNSINLHQAAQWMKKGSSPYWAFVGWIIPIYNFIRPYTFFNELWNESNYLLHDKSIVAKENKIDNNEFNIGIWWGLFLITIVLISYFIYATFFLEGPMYHKLGHTSVVATAIVFWVIYILQEIRIILKFNKLNITMCDNQSKF